MKNDEKYQAVFAKRLTNQRVTSWHRNAVKDVIKAVKADMPASTANTISQLKKEVAILNRRLTVSSNKNTQCWVGTGNTLALVSGSHDAIKEVQRLIIVDDKRVAPPEPDFNATPPTNNERGPIYGVKSETLWRVVYVTIIAMGIAFGCEIQPGIMALGGGVE